MRVVVVLQPNIFSHVPLMVCCSLMCWCSECGSAQPIIGGWTELWVFQKSNVQFAKIVKANVFLPSSSNDKNWTAQCLCLCECLCLHELHHPAFNCALITSLTCSHWHICCFHLNNHQHNCHLKWYIGYCDRRHVKTIFPTIVNGFRETVYQGTMSALQSNLWRGVKLKTASCYYCNRISESEALVHPTA